MIWISWYNPVNPLYQSDQQLKINTWRSHIVSLLGLNQGQQQIPVKTVLALLFMIVEPLQDCPQVLAVVVVKWSACSPNYSTIRVRMPLKHTVFSVKFVFEKNENKSKKRPRLAHFLKKILSTGSTYFSCAKCVPFFLRVDFGQDRIISLFSRRRHLDLRQSHEPATNDSLLCSFTAVEIEMKEKQG